MKLQYLPVGSNSILDNFATSPGLLGYEESMNAYPPSKPP